MSTGHTVILGAGFGGLAAATELAAHAPDGHRITLVGATDRFVVGATKLWYLDGRRKADAGAFDVRGIERHGVTFQHATVTAIDVAAKTVTTTSGRLAWDQLIIALGAETDPSAVPGLADHAFNFYTVDGVQAAHRALAGFAGGRALFLVTALPFKCPPAPYEAAMITADYLAGRGVEAQVTVASPEPQPLPVAGPACGAEVLGWCEARGVTVRNNKTVTRVDADAVHFKDGSAEAFDLLAAVPPHRAPRVLHEAGLLNDAGWVPVNRETAATKHADVWAVGDCNIVKLDNGKPLVKAGVMAEAEAAVVARNIAARLRGEPENARFDGKGVCFLETGGGEGVEVRGDFFATPNPIVAATPPSAQMLAAKARFEQERVARWLGA